MADLLLCLMKESLSGMIVLDYNGKVIICNSNALQMLAIDVPIHDMTGRYFVHFIAHVPLLKTLIAKFLARPDQPEAHYLYPVENVTLLLKCRPFMSGVVLSLEVPKKQEVATGPERDVGNHTMSHQALKLLQDAERALGNNEFVLFLQPTLNLKENRITTCEALVRWHHPEHGLMLPSDFLPLIERSELIHELVFVTLDLAMQHIVALDRRIRVAVNLSPENLFTPGLIPELEVLFDRYQVSPGLVCLELTETAMIETDEATRSILGRLQGMGIVVSLDDYGTGFSSLSHIRSLPISQIKIDRSFIKNIPSSEKDKMIVRSIMELAENLGLEVVIEGVESEAHWRILRVMGCDMMQGYYIARPQSIEDVRAFINNYRAR